MKPKYTNREILINDLMELEKEGCRVDLTHSTLVEVISQLRAPAPIKRWTAEDGTPPDGVYLTEVSSFGFAIEVRTEEAGIVVYHDDNATGLISIPIDGYWDNKSEMFGPIVYEGGADV